MKGILAWGKRYLSAVFRANLTLSGVFMVAAMLVASPAWATSTCYSATASTAVASPTVVLANGSALTTITVTLNTASGSPVPNKIVTLSKTGSAVITTTNVTTNGSGVATFTAKDATAQTVTFTAKATLANNPGCTAITISTKPKVQFAKSAPTVAKSFSPTTIAANGTSTLTITLTNPNTTTITSTAFTDTYPANLKNYSTPAVSNTCGGTATGTAGGGSLSLSGATIPASGNCHVSVTVTSATAGSYVNSTGAVTSPTAFSGTAASSTLTVTAISAGNSTVAASPASILADGVSTSTITVTLKDGASLPVSGKTVTLTAGSGSSTITTVSGTTNASGQATFTVKDSTIEAVTYTATDTTDSITVTPTAAVTFIAIPAIYKSFATSPVAANGTSLLSVQLKNATGSATTGNSFTDTYPAGLVNAGNASESIPANCGAGALTGTTGGNTLGIASTTIPANSTCTVNVSVKSATAGTYTNTATNNASVTSTASLVVTAISATNSTVSASPASVAADNSSTSTITVTLKDGASNPVSGKTVTLGTGGIGSSTISPSSATTNSSGVATFTVKDAVADGSITYTATDTTDSITVLQTASVTFTPLTAPTVTKSFNPSTIGDNGTSTLTITVTNPNTTAINNVLFYDLYPTMGGLANTGSASKSGSCTGATLSGATGDTSVGMSGATIAASSSCSVSVTVTAANATGQIVNSTGVVTSSNASSGSAASATLTDLNIDPNQSTVSASPTSVAADGTSSSTITVTLLDGSGAPVDGVDVSLAASGGSSTITAVSATTGAGGTTGVATFTVTDTVAEAVTYTATDVTDSITVTQTAPVTFTTPPSTVTSITCTAPCATVVNATTVSWTVTFNESVTGVDSTAFSLTAIGLSGYYISSITGSGTTWTVTAYTGTGSGSLQLNQNSAGSVSPALSGTYMTGGTYTQISPIFPASKLVFVQQPSNAVAGAANSPSVTVAIKDAYGTTVTSDSSTVTLAIGTNPGSGTLGGTVSVAAVDGVATFSNLSINKTGTGYTLAASDGALTGATSSAFNITVGATTQVAFVQQPSNAVAGAAISPSVTVAIQDANGNTVTTNTSTVTLAIGTNPGSGTLGGTVSVAAVAGVATFSNLSINKTGTGYTLAASDGALTGATSGAFNITAGAATKLAFVQQPSNALAGAAISPSVTVAIQDASGNTVTTNTSTVTLAIGTNPPGNGTLSGTISVAAVAGVATFSNLSINKNGTGYTLTASDGALTAATSNAFNITLPGQITVANSSFELPVQSYGGYTNGSASGTITGWNITSGIGGVFYPATGNMSQRAYDGNQVGYNQGGSITQTLSTTLAAYTQYALSVEQQNRSDGYANVKSTVQLLAGGNVLGSSVVTGGTGGTNVLQTVNYTTCASDPNLGQALGINLISGGQQSDWDNVILTGISFTPGSAYKLVFLQQPSNGVAGVAINPAITVAVQDQNGCTITSDTSTITLAIGINPGMGVIGGTVSVAAVAGVATFNNITISKPGTGYTLTANAPGLIGAISNPFNPGSITVNNFSFELPVQGSGGYTVGTATGWTVTGTGGVFYPTAGNMSQGAYDGNQVGWIQSVGGSLSQTLSTTLATYTQYALSVEQQNRSDGYTNVSSTVELLAGSNVLGSSVVTGGTGGTNVLQTVNFISCESTSNTGQPLGISLISGGQQSDWDNVFLTGTSFNLGSAYKLVFTQQPSSGGIAGMAINPAITVTVQDSNGCTVTTDTSTVTLAIGNNPTGGTLGGTVSVAAVAGVATFNNITISKAGTGYTLTASDGALIGATSNAFNPGSIAVNNYSFENPVQGSGGYTVGTATGWTVTGTGGVFYPTSGNLSQGAYDGNQVGWMQSAGGSLSQTLSTTLTNYTQYTLSVEQQNRTDGYTNVSSTLELLAGSTVLGSSIVNGGIGGTNVLQTVTYTSCAADPNFGQALGISLISGGQQSDWDNVILTGTAVTPGTATHLAFMQQPSAGVAGTTESPAITVGVVDSNGCPVLTDTSVITLALGSNPGGGTLTGTLQVAAVAGVATFSDLSIDKVGTGYTLAASDGALTGATSTTFNIVPPGAISINNFSFELPVQSYGLYTNGSASGTITGWDITSGIGGVFYPTTGNMSQRATDGNQVGYSQGGTISQTLSATLTANTQYTLQVDLLNRSDNLINVSSTVELLAGATVLGSNVVTGGTAGTNVTQTVSFLCCTGAYSSSLGQPLTISLISGGQQSDWDNVRLYGTPVTAGPDHIQITQDGNGLTCTPEILTVTACADPAPACATKYTLLPVSGNVTWSGTPGGTIPFNISTAGYTKVSLPVTTATTPSNPVILGTSSVSPIAINPTTCLNTSNNTINTTTSCKLPFSDAGLLISTPNLVSGTAQNMTVSAVKKSDSSVSCVPAFQNVSRSVNFNCSYTNPTSGTLPALLAGSALACDGSNLNLSMSFDPTGVATATLQYNDVGQVTLNGTYTGSAATNDLKLSMTGISAFVVKPDHFDISNIVGTAGTIPNPAAADANGSKFIRAGDAFTVTVKAMTAAGAPTPNYGKESTPQGVHLTPTLVAPAGGVYPNPLLTIAGTNTANNVIGGVEFGSTGQVNTDSNGVATVTNLAWNEVGIISLAANADNAGVNDYLGAGPVLGATTGTTGNIGRFYPAQFALSGGTIYNRTDISACATAGCGSFTYMGEQMNAVFTLTAQNLSGSPTLNYNYSSTSAKNFAKLDPTVFANLNMGAVDRVTTPTQPYLLSSRISVSGMPPVTCSTNPCFLAGVAKNIIAPFMITRGGSPDGVYTTVDIGINPTDEIGGATVPFNIDTTTATNPAVTMNSGKVGTTALRYGRMKISNASGSQLLSLPFSLTAQYWNV